MRAAQTLQTAFPLVYYDGIGVRQDWRLASPIPSPLATFARNPYLLGCATCGT